MSPLHCMNLQWKGDWRRMSKNFPPEKKFNFNTYVSPIFLLTNSTAKTISWLVDKLSNRLITNNFCSSVIVEIMCEAKCALIFWLQLPKSEDFQFLLYIIVDWISLGFGFLVGKCHLEPWDRVLPFSRLIDSFIELKHRGRTTGWSIITIIVSCRI